jgi:predicted RecA/RadA family phage recombinase
LKTYAQPGEVLALTAPSGGVTSGTPVLIGSLVVIPLVTAAETVMFSALVAGVATVPKATGTAWTEGAKLYWDVADGEFNTSSSGNTLAGVAATAAASAAATGQIRLDGAAR